MRRLRNRAEKRVPKIAPTTARVMRLIVGNVASGAIIQRPGIVKAKPPATIAPLLMIVWVTLIS